MDFYLGLEAKTFFFIVVAVCYKYLYMLVLGKTGAETVATAGLSETVGGIRCLNAALVDGRGESVHAGLNVSVDNSIVSLVPVLVTAWEHVARGDVGLGERVCRFRDPGEEPLELGRGAGDRGGLLALRVARRSVGGAGRRGGVKSAYGAVCSSSAKLRCGQVDHLGLWAFGGDLTAALEEGFARNGSGRLTAIVGPSRSETVMDRRGVLAGESSRVHVVVEGRIADFVLEALVARIRSSKVVVSRHCILKK